MFLFLFFKFLFIMKTTLKKMLATAGLVSIVAANSAFAVQIGSGTINGTFSSGVISTWNGTSDPDGSSATGIVNVQVSAQVSPTLNMDISTGAINYETLVPGVSQTGTLTVTTSTNAENGITVSMGSTGLESATRFIGTLTGSVWTLATTDTTDYYKVASSTTTSGSLAGSQLALQDVASSQIVLTTSNVADSNAATTVDVSAMAGSQTEAGNYTDTLVFTVTGNF